jgi:fructose-bisphosphate aldolase class II
VLHGSSGVIDEDLRRAVVAGITKINVGTLLNVHFTRAVRAHLDSDGTQTDPRRYLAPAREAVAEAVAGLIAAVN